MFRKRKLKPNPTEPPISIPNRIFRIINPPFYKSIIPLPIIQGDDFKMKGVVFMKEGKYNFFILDGEGGLR